MLTMPVTSATARAIVQCTTSVEDICTINNETPPDPPFPGLVACTAKKASYAPDRGLWFIDNDMYLLPPT
jgi:hypothetical protein